MDGCHWVYRMPEFNFKRNGATSKTSATSDSKVDKKASPTKSNFSRNSGKYATMPTKRSSEPIR